MALLTESYVRKLGAQTRSATADSAMLAKSGTNKEFDVFLSHSTVEPREIVDGIRSVLQLHGLSVYVDYHDDPTLSPARVNRSTAEGLRNRLRHSKSLLYIHSEHSASSKWMPWEMGFMDGLTGYVGIVPIVDSKEYDFKGVEYLSLYPFVDRANDKGKRDQLWINDGPKKYARLKQWIQEDEQIEHRDAS